MSKKRGTRATYIPYGGREIKAIVSGKETGVCQDKNGLYYYMYDDPKTGKRKKKTCTTDIKIAYNRFMTYVDGKRAEEFLHVKKTKHSRKLKEEFGHITTPLHKDTGKDANSHEHKLIQVHLEYPTQNPDDLYFDNEIKVSEQEFFHWLDSYRGKEEDLKRKSGIAIQFLGKTDRETHIKLQTILCFFEKNIKFKTSKTKKDYTKWCKHFFDFTDLIYIDDITEDIIRSYENEYLDPIRKQNGFAYKWKNDRAGAIKRVLSFYAEKHPSTSTKVKEIREYLMIWDRTQDRKPLNPECITKEDFMLLYQNANIRWKAILLMSLNSMSYAKDISDMEVAHIDKQRKTLKMIREKEGSLKVGYLWNETIEALTEYENTIKGSVRWLFTSTHKGKYAVSSLQDYIREFSRKIKGLSLDNITFEMLRNGASTAADDGELEYHYIEYGLGHQMSGTFSNYVKRRPERMKPVSENIYREYDISHITVAQ